MSPDKGSERDEQWALQKKVHQSTVIASDLRARAAREDERAAEWRKQLGQGSDSECEELAATLNDSVAPYYYYPFDWHEATGIAASLLACGYRKARTVSTVDELDALPFETVIRDGDACVLERWGDPNGWVAVAVSSFIPRDQIALPATVLYAPEVSK